MTGSMLEEDIVLKKDQSGLKHVSDLGNAIGHNRQQGGLVSCMSFGISGPETSQGTFLVAVKKEGSIACYRNIPSLSPWGIVSGIQTGSGKSPAYTKM